MKNKVSGKFFYSFFYSGIQAIGFQVLGVFFFYIISVNFSKENFGFISWANALCAFMTSLLSGGMEQIMVRRIAVSKTSDWAAAAYLVHSFVSSLIILAVLMVMHFLFKSSFTFYFLPYFFIAQAITYIAAPLKQFLNAKEKFAPYGIISIVSNLGKIAAALFLIRYNVMSISNMLVILISFAVMEFVCLFLYIMTKPSFAFSFYFKFTAYKKLLKESLPQYLAVIFDGSLSRMDWILLGLISTRAITADYSFAYRAHEIARLPLSIMAQVLLPRFARMMRQGNRFDSTRKGDLEHLFVIELFVSTGMIILLNIIWAPGIFKITGGKYGYSNSLEFLILTVGIPLWFFINILWTLCFAGKKYRAITTIIAVSAIVNVGLDLILIPMFGGKGAAIGFLATAVVQVIGYYGVVKKNFLTFPLKYIFIFYALGSIVYFGSGFITNILIIRVISALVLYISLCIILRLISKQQLISLRLFFE